MKADTALVAKGIAEVERIIEEMPDPNGIGASTLRLVVDAVAGLIKAEHPRFDLGEFHVSSMPISNERLKQAIITSIGRKGS